ncbi:hypothetical protein BJX70DRAFT_403036 [Aspergillus crustosus]
MEDFGFHFGLGGGGGSTTEESSITGTENSFTMFEEVLGNLNREALIQRATEVYGNVYPNQAQTANAVPVIGDFMYGSNNVILPLKFKTGIRWIARIPALGVPDMWDERARMTMTAENNTLRLLKRETTIPLQEIFDYSTSLENPLCCPYTILDFVPGLILEDVWKGIGVNPLLANVRRLRAMRDIAKALAQLSRYTAKTGGSLCFHEDGTRDTSRTGFLAPIDESAYTTERPDAMYHNSTDPKSYYKILLENNPCGAKGGKGIDAFLLQLIEWIPVPADADPFVLTHPDFHHMRNFIVNQDGELQSIIDWDGVGLMPRSLGNEQYPWWLIGVSDLGYSNGMMQQGGSTTDAYWRRQYEKLMASQKGIKDKYGCRMTRMTKTIEWILQEASSRERYMQNMLKLIWSIGGEDEPPSFEKLTKMFRSGHVDGKVRKRLRRGFLTLLHRGGW